MAAGDIIFEDGTIITPADLEKLIPLITNALGATAKDPSEYPILERLDDLTSLPVFDAAYNLGRVSILRLKGVNGKNAILRVQGDMLQWSLEGTDIWNDLYSKSELKGDPGAAANMEIGEVTSGDTPAATITGKAPNYKLNLVLVPGGKGDTGDNGKTPVLASVSAQSGETASGSFTDDGVDESGNPKYILNLTLPKGQDGQPAVFQQGTTTTLNPSEEARVEVIENGLTPEGNPKYLLNFFIPRGQMGPAGTGTGNVLVDATGLVSGKKYLFVPDSDGSTAGAFVEYEAPEIPEQVQPDWNATEGKGAILNKPGNATADSSGLMSAAQFQKLEKLSPSYLSNDVTGKKVEYTDDGKLLFEGKETFAVNSDGELTLDGKKMSELGGSTEGAFELPLELMNLDPETSTSDEIKTAIGGDEGFNAMVQAMSNNSVFCFIPEPGYFIIIHNYLLDNTSSNITNISFLLEYPEESAWLMLSKTQDNVYSFSLSLASGNVKSILNDNWNAPEAPERGELHIPFLAYARVGGVNTLIWSNSEDLYTSYLAPYFCVSSRNKPIEALTNGDGTKALMDDGTYKEVGGGDVFDTEIGDAVFDLVQNNEIEADSILPESFINMIISKVSDTKKSIKFTISPGKSEDMAFYSHFLGGLDFYESQYIFSIDYFVNSPFGSSRRNTCFYFTAQDKKVVPFVNITTNYTGDTDVDLVSDGEGTAFLSNNGKYRTPLKATTSADGYMSKEDKKKLDRIGSYTTSTTVTNLDANYENIEISDLSANASLSVNLVGTTYNGWDINVFIYCSSARTITIPTSGNYISMIGSSLSCPAGKWTELNLHCAGGKWRIAKLEQE